MDELDLDKTSDEWAGPRFKLLFCQDVFFKSNSSDMTNEREEYFSAAVLRVRVQ